MTTEQTKHQALTRVARKEANLNDRLGQGGYLIQVMALMGAGSEPNASIRRM